MILILQNRHPNRCQVASNLVLLALLNTTLNQSNPRMAEELGDAVSRHKSRVEHILNGPADLRVGQIRLQHDT